MILLLLGCIHAAVPEVEVPRVALRSVQEGERPAQLQVDRGLRAAAEELIGAATRADARLDPASVRLALARAGYPRDAHFLQAITADGSVPRSLLDAIPTASPADVGWGSRPAPGGGTRWILGWAPRVGSIDPLPRDVALDKGLPLRVDGLDTPRLFIGSPDGRAQEFEILEGVARWMDVFHIPGEYRVEVVDGDRVVFLFSLFVETPVPPAAPLPGPAPAVDPRVVSADLAARVNALRARTGLAPLTPFPRFEPETRAHAACLASIGAVAHSTPRCPGVPAMAERAYFPRADHHEDVVAADSAPDAWDRLYDSPGHRLNLLCAPCRGLTVGSALEGAPPSRVYSVIEVLDFPQGEPVPIIRGRQ